MIYNIMTEQQWLELKARTIAWLDTDIKEYQSGIKLLEEWTSSKTMIEQFRFGNPSRYMAALVNVLRKVKSIAKYPKLIKTKEQAQRLYMASVPVNTVPSMPGSKAKAEIIPPVTPEKWSRYSEFDTYKDQLPEPLRKEGEEWLTTWFTNRRRLHDLAKNQEIQGVDKTVIANTLSELSKQNDQIEEYFDRVEAVINNRNAETNDFDDDLEPSGRFTKAQIDEMVDPEFRTACKLKRKDANIKYITRKDVRNPAERALRIRELKEWGVDVDALLNKKA